VRFSAAAKIRSPARLGTATRSCCWRSTFDLEDLLHSSAEEIEDATTAVVQRITEVSAACREFE
jgi:hypothetical protein